VLANFRVRPPVALAILAVAVPLSGCSLFHRNHNKPDTTYAESPVDQLYAAGADKLDHHQWSDGVTYFKEVERQHPYSEWSRRSILMEAYAHYEANSYDDAIADANRFIELYPGNASTAYAYYIKAESYFEQILDVGRDQAATQQALSAMREVNRRYPKTEYALDARLKIDMINDQLAGKEMSVGRWYLRQGDTLAAIGRFRTVVDHFQTTSHTPEALDRLVESYLTLGLIDEAKRNAAVLGYNYPGDYWYVQAYNLMTEKGMRPEVEPQAGGKRGKHPPSAKHRAAPPPPSEPIPPNPVVQPDTPSNTTASADTTSPAQASDPAPAKKGGFHLWPFGGHSSSSAAPAAYSTAASAAPAS
jgi:outer membrane protein assembly factor BamD